ncbi:MAG: hypothetical protein IKP71_04605 [Candidatus Riflebacteria bacterium]|nr:hypothetical protein [Candidatus Riflebacteria bacterium]
MKKIWLLLGFIFITSFAFADCFLDGSTYFLNLEIKKAKEILGLTAEETADSEVYKEVVSHLKERYSLDIEKDIKQITLYMYSGYRSNDYIAVINGNFDPEKMQNTIKTVMESGKWRFQRLEDIEISGNKYKALRADGFLNIIFFDKNTIIISNDFIKKDKVKLSNTPNSINNLKQITNNYLYVSKDIFPTLKKIFCYPDFGLEKANFALSYIKDDKLVFEVDFNDSATSKEVLEKINNLSKEQIEKFKQNLNENLEIIKKEISDMNDNFTQNTFESILQSLCYSKITDLINILEIKQIDNSIVVSTDFSWNQISSIIAAFYYQIYESNKEEEKRYYCRWTNIYNLEKALEKYYKDHKSQMTTLDIKTLVKEKYLSEEPILKDPKCEYYLIDQYRVSCKKHGRKF